MKLSNEKIMQFLHKTDDAELFAEADRIRREVYGDEVYLRGLIEFTNYCANNCYYCGIRAGNTRLDRYRLDQKTILDCCRAGYDAGFRTFVLQGGEDPYFTAPMTVSAISFHRSTANSRTAQLRCPSANVPAKATGVCSMQAPADICCGTRRHHPTYTGRFILQK